ncbi:TonB-dependent receptor [Mucilaginibacter ximonensis]|uniref:TonB-dependent receptor n=1 Tax=Mucilaginibacter ximonensis TaxID=538021 RepID=A0ABW5YBP9_9SPHI
MKRLLLVSFIILSAAQVWAQRGNFGEGGEDQGGNRVRGNRGNQPNTTVAPPLARREVSGIIKDETGQTVIGATVTLKSKSDTINVITNNDGIFVMHNVKQNVFNITVTSIGYKNFVSKYAFSDAKKNLVLDPITLKTSNNVLNTVNINGTPSVTYKEDTVEYRASDYKVRANATLDELLKKMEGMEVGTDGTLTHQGQQVTKAKLNGKEYAGGDVAQAIQNLPADIIEKVQIVDDYGDQAARTGIKDGDPQKILNVTTKADRSVGTTGRAIGQYGSAGRYNGQLFVQRLNANEQLGLIGNLRNTVLGVQSTGVQGGANNDGSGGSAVGRGGGGGNAPSGGTTRSGSPSFNYRDQWSKKIQVVGSYAYNFRDNNAFNESYGRSYVTNGPFKRNSTSENDSKSHNLRFEMDINLDSANYLQITPNYSYSSSTSTNSSFQDASNYYLPTKPGDTSVFEHRVDNGTNSSLNSSTNYGITAFYLHLFKKPKRNFSLQLAYNYSQSKADGQQNTSYKYYADTTLNIPLPLKDSIAHNVTNRVNETKSLQAIMTYVEPLSTKSLLEFSTNWSRRENTANSMVSVYDKDNNLIPAPNLSSVYDYTVTDARATVDYRFVDKKLNVSVGASAVPFYLEGTKLNAALGTNASSSISNFRVIPAFRFAYSWSRTERFTLTYSGSNQEPSFTEIQPFTDISNPGHIIVGNPDLKPSFTNSLNAQYNNYFANSKFNLSFGVVASAVDNAIVENNSNPLVGVRKVNETQYLNVDGTKSVVGRYSISKQSENRAVNLALNGNISYSYAPVMLESVLYHQTTWRFDERFGPRITPSDDFEINPFVGYDIARYFTSLPQTSANANLNNPQVTTTSLGLQGRMYFFKTWQINYDATKRYITGINSGNTTPLVINAGFEKEFLEKRNLVFTFNVYDLLHQNNYQQKIVNAQGETNTISNTLSRYFMVGLRLNLQKWSGTPQRNGRAMQRRGDGSFIYN